MHHWEQVLQWKDIVMVSYEVRSICSGTSVHYDLKFQSVVNDLQYRVGSAHFLGYIYILFLQLRILYATRRQEYTALMDPGTGLRSECSSLANTFCSM